MVPSSGGSRGQCPPDYRAYTKVDPEQAPISEPLREQDLRLTSPPVNGHVAPPRGGDPLGGQQPPGITDTSPNNVGRDQSRPYLCAVLP